MIEKLKRIHYMFYARPSLYGLSLYLYFIRGGPLLALLFSPLVYCFAI